jgi:hypothetical protein
MIRSCEHIYKNERLLHTYPFTPKPFSDLHTTALSAEYAVFGVVFTYEAFAYKHSLLKRKF